MDQFGSNVPSFGPASHDHEAGPSNLWPESVGPPVSSPQAAPLQVPLPPVDAPVHFSPVFHIRVDSFSEDMDLEEPVTPVDLAMVDLLCDVPDALVGLVDSVSSGEASMTVDAAPGLGSVADLLLEPPAIADPIHAAPRIAPASFVSLWWLDGDADLDSKRLKLVPPGDHVPPPGSHIFTSHLIPLNSVYNVELPVRVAYSSCYSHSDSMRFIIDFVVDFLLFFTWICPLLGIDNCKLDGCASSGRFSKYIYLFIYLGGITVMGISTIITLLSPVLSTGKFRSFRAFLFVAMGLFGLIPAIHVVIVNGSEPQRNITLAYEAVMALSYLIGTVFYVSRIPERWKPGWFDLAGHSHQIFHVFVIMGALAHHGAALIFLEFRGRKGCERVAT
ncbi:hypothetical protein RJ640_000193 [Escallonia rubra]|uniref:Uncharacterized protein n=1 Tax=Escallonia rubra TaxID=112253 RepID=A0AA88RBI8_9ASTE|nr:hypothetical protein RJ640_000193 [Escallonia rubra]